MTVIEATKPKTPKGRIFSESVKRYAEDFVKNVCYIEQRFFENASRLSSYFNYLLSNFSKIKHLGTLGSFPEKVDTWADGRTTVLVNEEFMSEYQILESLQGIAKHALAHVDYQLKNQSFSPLVVQASADNLNRLFPLKSLSMPEKINLWKHCVNTEEETAVIRKTIEKDPHSAIAEDFEINDILFRYFSEKLKRKVAKEDINNFKNVTRKDFCNTLVSNFSVGKDVAFLTTPNQSVRDYRKGWIQRRKKMEENFYSEIASKFPEKGKILENQRIESEEIMDEFYSLIERRKPSTKEDFADFFVTIIAGKIN